MPLEALVSPPPCSFLRNLSPVSSRFSQHWPERLQVVTCASLLKQSTSWVPWLLLVILALRGDGSPSVDS